jgi:hypothetical protein
MRIYTQECRTSIRVVMGIIFLALAVFGWGVKYKISLYDPPGSISTHMSQAKLLSQKERPVSSANVDLARLPILESQSPIPYPTFVFGAIILVLSCGTAAIWMLTRTKDSDSWRQRCSFNSIYFSFRPPPALSPSFLK